MVTNNEVLTVSYGTFSCTLEGFDESFETMKAIAEYFRDLAADDRYFGAEPPTPDAEMLARIAEREIERRVQARTEHGAIVLSAGANTAEIATDVQEEPQDTTEPAVEEETAGADADIEELADAPAADEPTQEEVVVEEFVAEAEEVVAESEAEDEAIEHIEEPEIVDVTDAVLDAVTAPDADDVVAEDAPEAAEEVSEIESVVEEVTEASTEDSSDDSDVLTAMMSRVGEDNVAEDIEAPVMEDEQSDSMISDILASDTSIVALNDEEASVEEEALEDVFEEEVEDAVEVLEAEEPVAPAADDDSIAAKLQRIRAVVSKSADQPEDDDFSEDEHAHDMVEEHVMDASSVLTLDDQMAAAALAEDARADTDADDDGENASEAEMLDASEKPVRARVVRMKRSDFESAVDNGLLEAVPVEDDEDDHAEMHDEPESSLSQEEEAELLAELAQVEAELNDADPEDEPVEAIGAEFEDTVEDERPSRGRHLTDVSGQTDADMSRLMDEAQNQLNEPGGSRRRQAIAHLRAAVAATKAEKSAGGTEEKRDAAEAYRDDLASVVRPVPSVDAPKGAARASDEDRKRDAAPLKLVAEQRVDAAPVEAAAPAEETPRVPVRPRRVSAVDSTDREVKADQPTLASTDASSFSEFAENVGAHQLPEILEAAAAYLTFVEGHDVFSRPMVMRMVTSMDEQVFTREDSLRGFGQLLRENKIEKVSGGRFTASEEIRFKPEDRAAG